MIVKEDTKLVSRHTGFLVVIGERREINGRDFYPVVYDDFSSSIESEAQIKRDFKEIE